MRGRTVFPSRDFISAVYSRISPRYRFVNRIISLGMDRCWRRSAVRETGAGPGQRWLDLCTGTGETAGELRRSRGGTIEVTGLDLSSHMLKQAGDRREAGPIHLVQGDARKLPFEDGCFDGVMITFATRNIAGDPDSLVHFFREVYRVLRPGGRFVHLETSQPRFLPVRFLFRVYVNRLVPRIGALCTGYLPGYRFLSGSIGRFPPAARLSVLLGNAGFQGVWNREMMLGGVAVHRARKP